MKSQFQFVEFKNLIWNVDRAYGNNLYVLFFCLFGKKWLKNYWHFVTGKTAKSILISCGARPFLSDKYDITRHPNFKYTADADKRNTFDIEAFLSARSEEHTSELQSPDHLVCRLLLEKNFFNDTATTEIYTLSLHDALPIW